MHKKESSKEQWDEGGDKYPITNSYMCPVRSVGDVYILPTKFCLLCAFSTYTHHSIKTSTTEFG